LREQGYLTVSQLKQYAYYTVTDEGRTLLNRPHRKGVEWGDGVGDNTETLLHQTMVEALARGVRYECLADEGPDPGDDDALLTGSTADPARLKAIETVHTYHELDPAAHGLDLDSRVRLDLAAMDANGEIVLGGEAERSNNDRAEAAIADYDQLAAIDPVEALWVVPSNSTGQEAVLQPLGSPSGEREPRIREYSESTRISQIAGPDTAGMTGIFTLNQLRKHLPEPTL